jgi:hypothetical protein
MNMSGLLMHKAASTREELSSKELNQVRKKVRREEWGSTTCSNP